MAYCTNCGAEVQDGVPHSCGVAEKKESFDTGLVKTVLINPFNSLGLRAETHFLYGALGAAVAVLGFFVWGWMFFKNVSDLFRGLGPFGALVSEAVLDSSSPAAELFWMGLVSLCALIGSLYAIGNGLGSRKSDIKQTVTVLGAAGWVFGAGYLVAGILAFLTLQLSLLFVGIVLLTHLTVLQTLAYAHFEVAEERKPYAAGLSIGIYLIALMIVMSLF